jgi:crotonobetaine/carnitine-CoA ligase
MVRAANELILADLIAIRAEQKPDLDVLTFEGGGEREDEVRTYADLMQNGHRLAAALIERGMAPGDRFALLMRNHPEFVDCMIGASVSACVFVPIDPRTRGEKLAYTLQHSGCKGVVCADYSLAQLDEVRAQLPALQWIWVLESREDSFLDTALVVDAESFSAVLERPFQAVDIRLKNAADALEIIYTSGTTGDPKGVVRTNEQYGAATFFGHLVGFEEQDRPYTGLSLTHGNAQLMTLGPTLGQGLRTVFSRRFTKSRLWDITREYGCTAFNLLGGMATAIYSEPEGPDDADNPVRFVVSAGMPQAIWERFEQRFDLKILECYGAIEGGMAIKPLGVGPLGSFGKPPPGLEMLVVDENDQPCPPGAMGELVSRPEGGSDARVEYFGNEKASIDKTRGGWLRSGDVCHTDEEGWFFFDYRKGGGIRHNGDFVNPGFVEGVVAACPQVNDVFVYGVSAASGAPGEKDVVAAIVVSEPAAFDPAAVFRRCRSELESNFVPSYLQVVEFIPKTASEKPQERFLLDVFAADSAGVFTE